MSGKGLAFLNKKQWHVGTIRNQERVWKAEQDAAAEKKKLEEIRKQIEEERRIMELQQLKDSALPGHKKQARLEWMYQGMAAWQQASTDEYLKGKPITDQKEDLAAESKQLGLWRNKGITAQQDAWAKLRDDPLLEIRKQAQEQIAQLKKNPVQMEKIKQQLMEQARLSSARPAAAAKQPQSSSTAAPSSRSRRSRSRSRSPPRHRRSVSPRSPRRREPSPRRADEDRRRPRDSRQRRSRSRSPPQRRRSRSPARRSPRRSPPRRRDASPARSRSYKRNEMTEEERERRLAEMMHDAEVHREEQYKRLKSETAQQEKEDKELPNPEKLNFIHEVNKSVYDAKATSVEDRLQRNRHFRQNSTALEESGIATRV